MTESASLKILLVEDDPADCDFVKRMIARGLPAGYHLSIATTLQAALGLLRAVPIDLILLDLNLPDSRGMETLQQTQEAAPAAAIIVLSSDAERHTALQAVRHGAHDYFPKDRMNPDALARVARFAVERHRWMGAQRDLQAAERVQQRLFPKSPPEMPEFDIAGMAYSAGTGCGDYYDFLRFYTGELGLVVGDVSGHGVAAALRMIETRAYLRSLARHEANPGIILTELNRFMIEESAYGDSEEEKFVTLFLAKVDPVSHEFQYAAAGQSGYLVRQDETLERLTSTGLPLGIADYPIERSTTLTLHAGDTLLLVTDGLADTMSPTGELFGVDRMLSRLQSFRQLRARDIVRALYQATCNFSETNQQLDDITAIVLNVKTSTTRSREPVCSDFGGEETLIFDANSLPAPATAD